MVALPQLVNDSIPHLDLLHTAAHKLKVAKNRKLGAWREKEMTWIKIRGYFKGDIWGKCTEGYTFGILDG